MKFWNVYNIFFSLVLQELYRFVLFRSFYYIEVFVLFRSMYLYYFEFVVFKKNIFNEVYEPLQLV